MKNPLFGRRELNHIVGRRRFLELVALVTGAGAAALMGCDDDPGTGQTTDAASPDADTGVDAFVDDTPADVDALFAAVQQALRQSPDHAPARAAALVALADAGALLAFVRDDIQTYPTRHNYMANAIREQRWGWQGALRGAAGTPREKAELLAELYRQAGFEAEVFAARLESPPEDWRAWLCIPDRPGFAPALTGDQITRWGAAFGSDLQAGTQIDGDGQEARKLADELVGQVDVNLLNMREVDFRASDQWPVVRLRRGQKVEVANLWDPLATLSSPRIRPEDAEKPALEPSPTASVELILEATLSDTPLTPVELVRGSWAFPEVVGRQLVLKLDPALTLEQAAQTAFKDVTTFVPLMVWQGMNLSLEEGTRMSVVGTARLNTGEVVVLDGERLRVAGTLVEGPELPRGNAIDVARLEIHRVNTSCFPQIVLEATAFDTQGNPVEGLTARDLVVEEDGAGQAATMRSNARRPRIIVLADDSGSMPAEFRGEAGAVFAGQLLEKLQAQNPLAEIEFRKTSSNIFTEAAAASRKVPTLVIYLTDGDVNDALTPEIETVLRQGPPVVAISVYGTLDADLQQIADFSGGAQYLITEVEAAVIRSAEFVGQQILPSYIISYTAPRDGQAVRNLRLGVQRRPMR